MSNKIRAMVLLGFSMVAMSGCNFWKRSLQEVINDPFDKANNSAQYIEAAPLQMPTSVVVCRSKQCAPVKISMSAEYIYNSLVQMVESNNHQKALVCAADAGSRNCYQSYLSAPINVGMAPAYLYIDSVKISNVHINKGSKSIKMSLNYGVSYNGQTPICAPSNTQLYVKNSENIIMSDNGYQCKMTTIGTSAIKTLFLVDYIDLDFGFIGGYYSIGVSGPANGGGTGYMLIRLSQIGYPKVGTVNRADEDSNPVRQAAAEYAKEQYLDSGAGSADSSASGVKVFPIKR